MTEKRCTHCSKKVTDLFKHGRDKLCKQCFLDKPKRPPGRPKSNVTKRNVSLWVEEEIATWLSDADNRDLVIKYIKKRI